MAIKKLVIAEGQNILPEIREWQIKQYYDKEEVEWLDKDTILLHGMNEGRKFRVVKDSEDVFETQDLPKIANWQIREFWNRNDYKFIAPNIVERTDGRRWKVYNGESVAPLSSPIPQSVEWHKATNWRHAKLLYATLPTVWNEWKKNKLIPHYVIARVEGNE